MDGLHDPSSCRDVRGPGSGHGSGGAWAGPRAGLREGGALDFKVPHLPTQSTFLRLPDAPIFSVSCDRRGGTAVWGGEGRAEGTEDPPGGCGG